MTVVAPARHRPRPPVVVEPLGHCLISLVPVLALWALVRLGRLLCLVAQRVPLAVHVVRWLRTRRARSGG